MMTKRDYEVVAKLMARVYHLARKKQSVVDVAKSASNDLRVTNPRFDEFRFIAAVTAELLALQHIDRHGGEF